MAAVTPLYARSVEQVVALYCVLDVYAVSAFAAALPVDDCGALPLPAPVVVAGLATATGFTTAASIPILPW